MNEVDIQSIFTLLILNCMIIIFVDIFFELVPGPFVNELLSQMFQI